MNIKSALDKLQYLNEFNVDEFLDRIGLERKRTAADRMIPAVGLFGVGILVGTGLGLLLAPVSGREARDLIGQRVNELGQRVGDLKEKILPEQNVAAGSESRANKSGQRANV